MQVMPMFGNLAFAIIAFVVALSVIVAIHEYGHYIVGRWCGIHAEVFSLGFGPVIWSGTDKRGTQWQVAALPLGGYVKFLGDANAASVGSDGKVPPEEMRRTMLGAPLWARVATVAAGPIFNFILAIAIFAGSLMYEGRAIEPLTFGEMRDLPASYDSDLQHGDVLVAVEGLPFNADTFNSLDDEIPLRPRLDYTVLRDGQEVTVEGPYLRPPAVTGVVPRSAADDAGLRIGDVITAVDGAPVFAFQQLVELVKAAEGAPLDLTIQRGEKELNVVLSPRATDEPGPNRTFERHYRIGITGGLFFEFASENMGLFAALEAGARGLWTTVTTSLSAMEHIVMGKISTCNLSGPVGIAETSGSMASQGTQSFIWFIGMLSAGVGLINLFPIPVLDGGHLVLYAYEGVTRRKPSEKVIQVFMFAGLAVILTMMSFTVLNDLLFCP